MKINGLSDFVIHGHALSQGRFIGLAGTCQITVIP
jgi:hypothetical protein